MNIKCVIEGILFISGESGATFDKLKKLTKLDDSDLLAVLEEMDIEYHRNSQRGLLLKHFGNSYKLVTKPEINKIIAKNFDIKFKNPLNNNLLEVLAIIAYNEPCTRSTIHELKNVDPTPLIDKLIELGLVEEAGRSEALGKPYLYQVTKRFYDMFGINSIKELPEIIIPEFNPDDYEEIDDEDEEENNFFDTNRTE